MDADPDGSRAMIRPRPLAIVEVLDRDGHARSIVPVAEWPITIGRAIDCDVVLDDVHVAAHHATIDATPAGDVDADGDSAEAAGALTLQVGDTVNGVQVARRRLLAKQNTELASGEIFHIGTTRLRVRRAADAVAPEQPLTKERGRGRVVTLVLFLAFAAWNVAELWLHAEPDERVLEYWPLLILLPAAIGGWSGFWSVLSRLITHRFEFWRHVRIAIGYALVISVLGLVLPLTAFALGWAFPSRVSGLVAAGVAWAMVLAHLFLILPARRRLVTIVMSVCLIGGVSIFLVRNYQVHDRLFDEAYVATLAPPALRLAPTVETRRFIDEARDLKAVLDAHAKDDDDGPDAGSE